jgi:hypothetical protein
LIQKDILHNNIPQEIKTDITKHLDIRQILEKHKCHIPYDLEFKQEDIAVYGHAIARERSLKFAPQFYSESLEGLIKENKYPSHVAKELVESFETELGYHSKEGGRATLEKLGKEIRIIRIMN